MTVILEYVNPQIRRRQWHPTPVLLPGNSHGRRSLVGCGPWGESDMTEQLRFHFSLSCIGEGNGNPLQWRIPGTEEPGGLPSMGSHRVRHDWSDLAAAAAAVAVNGNPVLSKKLRPEILASPLSDEMESSLCFSNPTSSFTPNPCWLCL